MNKILAAFLFSLLLSFSSEAQGIIHHWETAVYDTLNWKYFVGTSDPGANWKNKDFDDNTWLSGKGGIGFGDADDNTSVEITTSVFLRYTFQVTDKTKIQEAILSIDYDDGFVAYLNGTEIARSNMSQSNPAYFDFSQIPHEALLYQGEVPEGFPVKEPVLNPLLSNGPNVLCIQVHNSSATSDDLTARAFLSFAIKDNSSFYGAPPSWFNPPQTFVSSNLPIVFINTANQEIVEGEKTEVHMGIIYNGGNRNNITDPYNNYDNKVKIQIKETSQKFSKKTYVFETLNSAGADTAISLMGLPKGNEWVLYAPYSDKSLMRDALTYKLARSMGNYASRTKYCEVLVNNDYKGVYILLEKIKIDSNRVNIRNLSSNDTTEKTISGGYIIKVDKLEENGYPAWASIPDPKLPDEDTIVFQFHDPQGNSLTDSQQEYIKKYIFDFESTLSGSKYKDYTRGFRKYIDVASFIDYMLINEVNKSIDAYLANTYMYKNLDSLGGKLMMGPLWDYSLAFGNVDYHENSQEAPGWIYEDKNRMYWFRRMMTDIDFKNQFQCRFLELRLTALSSNNISQWIDSTATSLAEGQQRNFKRWPILDTYVWPNQFVGSNYNQEVNFLKQWIIDRLDWMDLNLESSCNPTGIDDLRDDKALVFPNPSSKDFDFVFKKPLRNAEFKVFDSSGKLLYSTRLSGSSFKWDANLTKGVKIQPGLYFYKITDRNNLRFSGKLIKH